MSTLGRRLTALEAIADQCWRNEIRDLVLRIPDAHDFTPDEVEQAIEETIRILGGAK